MSFEQRQRAVELKKTIDASGYFTLAFGAIVGSGWIIVLGDWLRAAGPGGATVGFLTGGAAMIIVGLCYAELTARMPRAGGEFLYARERLGERIAFIVGWFLTLYMISVPAFEGIVLGVLMQTLIPALKHSSGYELLGQHVFASSVAIGLIGALGIGTLNLLGSRIAVAFQKVVTYSFLAIIASVLVIAVCKGKASNLRPLFPEMAGVGWVSGAFWIFSTSGMFLNGFQAALHTIEERGESTSLRRAALSMVAAIGCAALFYSFIVLVAAGAVPWRALLGEDLPAASAFAATLKGGVLGMIVVVAATFSLLKTWNAATMMASRLLFAQARVGYLPQVLVTVSGRAGVPSAAILIVTFLSASLIPLGRGFVVPIVNMVSICLSLNYVMCMWILLKCRSEDSTAAPPPAYQVPGGRGLIWVGLAITGVMAATALVGPAVRLRTVPPEWLLIGAWATAGFIIWAVSKKHLRSATGIP